MQLLLGRQDLLLVPLVLAATEGQLQVASGEGEEPHSVRGRVERPTLVQVVDLLRRQTASEF